MTETWLKDHKDAELSVENYKIFRSDRSRIKKSKRGRLSGGVAVYLHESIANETEVKLRHSNGKVEILGLYLSRENLYLATIYRQPDDVSGGNRSTFKELREILNMLQKSLDDMGDPLPNVLLCGDFNIPEASWLDGSILNGNNDSSLAGTVSNFMDRNFLQQHIDYPTHRDGNTLDLVFTNNSSLIHSHQSLVTSMSDHKIIECCSTIGTHHHNVQEEKPAKSSQFDYLNFHSNDIKWDTIAKELNDIDWPSLLLDQQPDNMIEIITNRIYTVCEKHVPTRKSTRSGKPKIPRDRRILMRKRKKILDKLSLKMSPIRQAKLNRKLVDIELALQHSYKSNRHYNESKAIQAIRSNPKYFYSYAKKFSKSKTKIGPLLDENNMYTSSSKQMADILSEQYQKVFSKPVNHSVYKDKDSEVTSSLCDIEFTEQDIIDAIDELSNNATSGPDGISAVLLKACKKVLCKPLYILWRKCLDLGVTPESLKIAHITPIFKDGHQGVASNYRPIALTSHLIKIFEKVVRNNITKYLEDNHLFNTSQHGFRRRHSCLSQLLNHFENIISRLEELNNVDVIYLDFAKAFDKVDHSILMEKLRILGIQGTLYVWIESFLRNRKQKVMVNGFLSDPVLVKSGVPQGSVLGPLLFLIMIYDIDCGLLDSFLSSFADDTRLGMSIKNQDDVIKFQDDLNRVYKWAKDNNMDFNNNKFEAVRYGLNTMLKETTKYFGPDGIMIETKTHVKDLGVTMSSDASFCEHVTRTCQKARNMVAWILRTFKTRDRLPMITLWKSLVQPIMDYCSQLWCPTQPSLIKQLEAVQQNFTRKVKVDQKLDYWERLKELKLLSQQRRRERYRILYCWKVVEGIAPTIPAIEAKSHPRNGRTILMKTMDNKTPSYIQKARDASINIHGAKLFNLLPKDLRNKTDCSLESFKYNLDKFLSSIPDEPWVQNYCTGRNSFHNSLLHCV